MRARPVWSLRTAGRLRPFWPRTLAWTGSAVWAYLRPTAYCVHGLSCRPVLSNQFSGNIPCPPPPTWCGADCPWAVSLGSQASSPASQPTTRHHPGSWPSTPHTSDSESWTSERSHRCWDWQCWRTCTGSRGADSTSSRSARHRLQTSSSSTTRSPCSSTPLAWISQLTSYSPTPGCAAKYRLISLTGYLAASSAVLCCNWTTPSVFGRFSPASCRTTHL